MSELLLAMENIKRIFPGLLRSITFRWTCSGKIVAIGFDGAPILQEYVKKGVLQAIMVQSPFNMGYLGVKTAWDKIYKKPVKDFIDTGVYCVTTENIGTDESQKALGNK